MNSNTVITSSTNPLIKRIRALADRKQRQRERAFFVDGIQPVWRAAEAGAEIDVLVVAPDLLRGSPAEPFVAEQEAAGTRVARVSADLFAKLSGRDGPSGLGAIVCGSVGPLAALRVEEDAVLVVLHEIANPGNLGTIIRTADAAGAAAVILLGTTTDPFAPTAVKASMGSLFAVPMARERSVDVFFSWCADHGITVLTTSARADVSHWDATYATPLALLLGSEGDGLSREVLERGDVRLRIPMVGTASSLNLSVAGGILIYQARREALQSVWASAAKRLSSSG